jgi:hypothetical protein
MTGDLFNERLSWFKQNEKPEAMLALTDKAELLRIVVVWSNITLKHNGSLSILGDNSENEIWNWLWKNTMFSLTELKKKIGFSYSESVLEQRIQLLIGNRIIYPDGTVNSYVQRYLRERVVAMFNTKAKKA